jgi:hypothetical protein
VDPAGYLSATGGQGGGLWGDLFFVEYPNFLLPVEGFHHTFCFLYFLWQSLDILRVLIFVLCVLFDHFVIQPRQTLLSAASRVGEASYRVLYTIGEEEIVDRWA